MLLKYLIFGLILLSAVDSQNLRVRRQGVKGYGPRPQTGYRPQSQVGAPQRTRPRPVAPRPRPQEEEGQVNSAEGEANPEPPIYGGVMGTPGVDFPGYTQIPRTSFVCSSVPYEPGMYADMETDCQAYHVCFQGRKESFLCGVGTVFNQAILACDYWHSVECARTPEYYSVNEELGKAGAEPGPGGAPAKQPQQPRPASRPQPQQRPYQPQPSSQVRPNIPQRPQQPYRPQPVVPQRPQPPRKTQQQQPYPQQPYPQQPQPYPQQARPISPQRPQPQPQRPYQPQPVKRPQPPRPVPQQPYQPQPAHRPLAPRPQQPYQPQPQIGKPSPSRPRPPPPPPQIPIVQMREEDPIDYYGQRQQSYDY